jgi:integrase
MSLNELCREMHAANLKSGGEGWLDPKQNRVATPHGFRSAFKDWCRNKKKYADEVSELALAHVNSDETRAAYARDELLSLRVRMMRDWARYCFGAPSKQGSTST